MAWQELGGANTGLPNNAIDANVHWLGTTNNDPLIIRTENGPSGAGNAPNPQAEVMRITPADPAVFPGDIRPRSVGVGTTRPRAKLHLNSFDPRTLASIHAGGINAALSFASRSYRDPIEGLDGGFLGDGRAGARWDWVALGDGDGTHSARLRTEGGGPKLIVTSRGQVRLPGGLLDGTVDANVAFPDVPIGALPQLPTSPPLAGELVLNGVRTSIRGFDGQELEEPTAQEGFGMRLGNHWIRTNGNEGELWMAFRRSRSLLSRWSR